ncbi:MAG TPA: isochorismatase family protein [Anaerolineaceae bacterium]|nr:isochorismatase family protein [Anaerolineaceae bacterium]HQJ32390.1 isochorismatase family protein [Anaerolineaceae bacterium]
MTKPTELLKTGDALLIIDVQIDFCPGGSLPIEEGDQIVPVLNEWIEAARVKEIPVYASRDWHPHKHPSFKENGGLWPVHCLQDSLGAGFHPDLNLPEGTVLISKGVRFDQDQNSAFDQTGLVVHFRKAGIRRLYVGGLAEDVCVLATVLDACHEGFETVLIRDATRAITQEGGRAAREAMRAAGARFISTEQE